MGLGSGILLPVILEHHPDVPDPKETQFMNPVVQTVIVTVIASILSPLIVFLVTRYIDRHKDTSQIRLSDLESIEKYQKIMDSAIDDVESEKKKRTELEKRVAELEAATVGPFEIILTVVTRPTPIIKSQSIRLVTPNEAKQ